VGKRRKSDIVNSECQKFCFISYLSGYGVQKVLITCSTTVGVSTMIIKKQIDYCTEVNG